MICVYSFVTLYFVTGINICAALWLLSLIFQPIIVKLNKPNNKRLSWPPSKVEQSYSIIRFVNVSV